MPGTLCAFIAMNRSKSNVTRNSREKAKLSISCPLTESTRLRRLPKTGRSNSSRFTNDFNRLIADFYSIIPCIISLNQLEKYVIFKAVRLSSGTGAFETPDSFLFMNRFRFRPCPETKGKDRP
jgi:hypothetical protein